MSIDVREDKMQHAELFGKPVLYSKAHFARDTVPKGWYCYDIRGTDREPLKKAILEDHVSMHYAGSVLSPVPLKKDTAKTRQIRGQFLPCGEEIGLEAFCKEHNLEYPADPRKYIPRPASPDEAGLFYAMPPEKDAELGCIGHVRIDFGRGGGRFYSTWHPRGPEELNTPEFKAEIDEVVNELRQGVLRDLNAMTDYCGGHGGQIEGGWCQNYGYIVETESYRYCLRCNPMPGDYQAYLTCFDKKVQEMNQASRENQAQGPADLRITDFFSGEPVTLRPRLELYSVKGLMGRDMPGLAVRIIRNMPKLMTSIWVKDLIQRRESAAQRKKRPRSSRSQGGSD